MRPISVEIFFICSCLSTIAAGNQVLSQRFGDVVPARENSVGSLLFEREVVSRMKCAAICSSMPLCKFVAVSSLSSASASSIVCQGYAEVSAGDNGTVITDPTLDVWSLRESVWVEKTCSSNAECGESPRECYEGTCLCTPGYFYSLSQDSCIQTCPKEELQQRFLIYPGYRIWKNNIDAFSDISLTDCLEACLQNLEARTCDYGITTDTKSRCHIQNVTLLDLDQSCFLTDQTFTTYQKICI